MKVFVFVGPTISRHDAERQLSATYLPPVAQGDVYRAAKERPFAIGIVDGYFERIPAVWHKEILWALSQGIHVFGAASMGALRAAELSAFGMKGVGVIFEAFHSGEVEDDDEVAVAHGDEATGYRATSEAMVNIRATFRRAEKCGVVTAIRRAALEAIAKRMWYPDRTYSGVFARAVEEGASVREMEALRTFVATQRVDQKRNDAMALLEAVRACAAAAAAPPPVRFFFAHTEAWDQVIDWAEVQPSISCDVESVSADMLTAEVRLSGASGRAALAAGFTRAVAGLLARRSGIQDRTERAKAIDWHLRHLQGGDDAQLVEWQRASGLTRETYGAFLERNAEFAWLRERYRGDVDRHIVDELRLNGAYPRLSERARDKERLLTMHGLAEASLKDAGISESELISWYFEQFMGIPVPPKLEAFLPEIAAASIASLQREALREYLYSRLSAATKNK